MEARWWRIFYCAKNRVLFSGLQRNTQKGVDFVAEELNVNEVVLIRGEGFHLDTFFTPALDKDGYIAALIICEKILDPQSKKDLFDYADANNFPIFIIPENDALGTKTQAGRFAVNALPLPGLLLRPNYFSNPAIDDQLSELKIKIKITPTSQFQLSGGSIHCVTNEL